MQRSGGLLGNISASGGVQRALTGIRRFLPVFLLLMGAGLFGYSQTPVKVSGTVTDDNGAPLAAVTVSLKGSKTITTTDADGRFSIDVPDARGTLLFSSVGYAASQATVNGPGPLAVRMAAESQSLTGVVVVGYGTQKKSDLTGSVVSISEKDFKNYAVPNASQLLQGKAPGVFVSTLSGQPGEQAVVRIRGFGTVNDNNPLYVIDGQLFNDINNINPNDIQNIEVLKDASATAIYGSRGSNGVILITTKRARKGESIASFDSYIGSKTNYNPPRMQNSDQFYDFITTAYANSGQTIDPKFKQQYDRGYDTDWWKELSRNGLTQNYNFNVRNGGEKARTYFGLGYMNDKGALIQTDFSRVSLKFNAEYDLSKRITVGVNAGIANNRSRNSGSLPRFDFLLQAEPFIPVINPAVSASDPNYAYNKYMPTEWAFNPNPVAIMNLNDRQSKDINLYGNVFGRVKLFDGLSYYIQYNFEHDNNRFKLFVPIYKSVFSDLNLANQESKYNNVAQLTENTYYVVRSVIEQRLNYTKAFGKHNVDAMVAMTYDENRSDAINAFKTGAPGNDEAFRVFDAATTGMQISGRPYETAILSYLGRLNYAYADRYLMTVNFRADGSSIFSPGYKWGYFPSFSLGWRINNESFFKNSSINDLVSNLKLRAGWGRTGNQNINSYAPVTLIGTNIENQWNFGNGPVQGYIPTNIGNPEIKWETSEQTNIGLDLGLFNDRLAITADYFIKKTKGMLLQPPLPVFSGYPNNPYSNAGSIENRGFEMAANYRTHVGELSLSVGANASFYKNRVTALDGGNRPLYGNVSKTEVGGPMSRFYGWVWEGVFQNQAEIDGYKGPDGQKIQPNATPGDFKFADLDHNGVIDDKDRTYIGNPHPDLIYGFNIALGYKNFDFSAFFQGTLGNDLWNGLKGLSAPGASNSLEDAYTKAWFKEGDQATYPKPSLLNANNNYRASTWWVESGSFMRLQNIQLGYTLPSHILQNSKLLNSCRIYVSGQNLFTITRYSGMDPEIGAANALNLGYDPIRYPSSRTVLAGINIQF